MTTVCCVSLGVAAEGAGGGLVVESGWLGESRFAAGGRAWKGVWGPQRGRGGQRGSSRPTKESIEYGCRTLCAAGGVWVFGQSETLGFVQLLPRNQSI